MSLSIPVIKYLPSHLCVLSCLSHVQLCATLWTVPCQDPLSMGFSRQEYCSGLPCPAPGDLFDPGIEPTSLVSPALAGGFFTTSATWEAQSTGDQAKAKDLNDNLIVSRYIVSAMYCCVTNFSQN